MKGNHPPFQHCGKKGHPPFRCWRRPDAKCSKCNQQGHKAVICKSKVRQQKAEVEVADEEEEDQLLVASCFTSRDSSENSLIDSGCTNHMTYDKELFKGSRKQDIVTQSTAEVEFVAATAANKPSTVVEENIS